MRDSKAIFMPSPINAVLEGLYEANTTMGQLKDHGNFGIGTFNDLDGEMVMIDGAIYQLDVNGNAHQVADNEKTPFAAICDFQPISSEQVDEELTPHAFDAFLTRCLPSPNMLYAIQISGRFTHVRTRSVPRTSNYTPLVEATASQKESTFEDIQGTLVGFYTPDFVPSVNVPGYHFHFITADHRRGGHMLQCSLLQGTVEIEFYSRLDLNLPMTLDYLGADFQRDAREDLEKAEH